jgi:ELWxxDGT repeat protein
MAKEQPTHLTDNALYFTAFTEETGAELYRIGLDGIPTLVADINQGPDGSSPGGFTEFNDQLYFTAVTEETGAELYQVGSDGTPTLVADINPGPDYSSPDNFFVL